MIGSVAFPVHTASYINSSIIEIWYDIDEIIVCACRNADVHNIKIKIFILIVAIRISYYAEGKPGRKQVLNKKSDNQIQFYKECNHV